MRNFADILGNLSRGDKGAILAPMVGVTDVGMRRAAQEFGATYTVSEMIDGRFCSAADPAAARKSEGRGLDCHIVQIAGCSESTLSDAARFAEAHGADAIDINMGCPAKKVVGGLAGSALMRDLELATRLIRAVVSAVAIPVSVKMRLGWDDGSRNAPDLARRAEGEGVSLVTVHGRTRCQFYSGAADWSGVCPIVGAVKIPVVVNGDCAGIADAREMLARSGAAAVMVGRAAIGRPWLVGGIAHALRTGCAAMPPSTRQRHGVASRHLSTLLSQYGSERGIRHARKHLAAYAVDAGTRPGTRRHLALVTEADPKAVFRLLDEIFDNCVMELAA